MVWRPLILLSLLVLPSSPFFPAIPTEFPLCHSRRVLAGIHGLFLLALYSCAPAWGKFGIPDYKRRE